MTVAPSACFFLRFLSVNKAREGFKTLIFVPLSLPTGVKYHLAGSELAYYGGWWYYKPTHLMLGHTPLYVLLFEGLIVAALPFLYDRIERRAWLHVAIIGVIVGAWMPFAALFSWLLLGL